MVTVTRIWELITAAKLGRGLNEAIMCERLPALKWRAFLCFLWPKQKTAPIRPLATRSGAREGRRSCNRRAAAVGRLDFQMSPSRLTDRPSPAWEFVFRLYRGKYRCHVPLWYETLLPIRTGHKFGQTCVRAPTLEEDNWEIIWARTSLGMRRPWEWNNDPSDLPTDGNGRLFREPGPESRSCLASSRPPTEANTGSKKPLQ
jgi:hypothetical protein